MNNPIKQIIKRSIQHAAAKFGPHSRTSGQPRLLILMYHRILPADDPRTQLEEPGMVVTPCTFAQHLQILQQHFSIVRLSDWLQDKEQGKTLPQNACAITFDDGWLDNYEYAFPLLQEFGLPATIYLVAGMIGTNKDFWPGRVARLISAISTNYPQYWHAPEMQWLPYSFTDTPAPREQLSHTIATLKRQPDEAIHRRLDDCETALGIEYDNSNPVLLNWNQVKAMQKSGLIDFGSHTCNHIRLNRNLGNDTLHNEIIDSKQLIEQHTGHPAQTFCYPNGDLCEQAIRLVAQTYKGAVTTRNGWNDKNSQPHRLQRIGIHEDTASDRIAFLARLSGWV